MSFLDHPSLSLTTSPPYTITQTNTRLFLPLPSSWWISPLFAFHAGILDSSNPRGGVVSDSKGAYAVLLTGADELSSASPDKFVYRARDADRGRYRLTAATLDSRHPVRVLRSHALRSFWSPRVGVRYEGL